MKLENLNFSGYVISANSYDNMGAHNTVKFMMQKGEYLTVKFRMDKGGYDYAWVESRTLKGFKYQLAEEGLKWLLNYMQTGALEDNEVKPDKVTPEEEEGTDFQTEILKFFIEMKFKVQCTPTFRETSGYINAIASFKKGKVIFKIKHTEELVDYLREKEYLI